MRWSAHISSVLGVGLQAAIAIVLLAGLIFVPMARGPMLLVPVTDRAAHGMAKLAFAHGAMLVGPGPFRGSLVMTGSGRDMMFALLAHGVIAVAAPPSLCGEVASDGGVR